MPGRPGRETPAAGWDVPPGCPASPIGFGQEIPCPLVDAAGTRPGGSTAPEATATGRADPRAAWPFAALGRDADRRKDLISTSQFSWCVEPHGRAVSRETTDRVRFRTISRDREDRSATGLIGRIRRCWDSLSDLWLRSPVDGRSVASAARISLTRSGGSTPAVAGRGGRIRKACIAALMALTVVLAGAGCEGDPSARAAVDSTGAHNEGDLPAAMVLASAAIAIHS